MEDGAAARQTGIGARQQIDPDASLESMIGPQPFDNHNAPLQPVKAARVNDQAAAPVPDAHPVAVPYTQSGQYVRMNEGDGPALAGDTRRRVVEARVEERPRRRGDQPERLFGVTFVDDRDMVGERGQLPMLRPDRRPIGAKMKFSSVGNAPTW